MIKYLLASLFLCFISTQALGQFWNVPKEFCQAVLNDSALQHYIPDSLTYKGHLRFRQSAIALSELDTLYFKSIPCFRNNVNESQPAELILSFLGFSQNDSITKVMIELSYYYQSAKDEHVWMQFTKAFIEYQFRIKDNKWYIDSYYLSEYFPGFPR